MEDKLIEKTDDSLELNEIEVMDFYSTLKNYCNQLIKEKFDLAAEIQNKISVYMHNNMEDKELIEKWREEYIELRKNNGAIDVVMSFAQENGEFKNKITQIGFNGFLLAKRNMPVVELPEKDHYYLDDDVYDADEVYGAINRAGIPYKVNGE